MIVQKNANNVNLDLKYSKMGHVKIVKQIIALIVIKKDFALNVKTIGMSQSKNKNVKIVLQNPVKNVMNSVNAKNVFTDSEKQMK